MGKQPEPEDQIEEPVSERDAPDADVEVDATLDLTLGCAAAAPFDDAEATPLAMCQICMDYFGSKEVVRNVCGPQCHAEVCPDCLVQHLTASAYSYYPGVLPKMRCPVCLVVMNKIQWKQFVAPARHENDEETVAGEEDEVDDASNVEGDAAASTDGEDEEAKQEEEWIMDHSHVLEKFEMLCRQSCSFQAPCCHNTEYSMLAHLDEDSIDETIDLKLPSSQAVHLPQLSVFFREYCFHRIDVGEFYDFVMEKFGPNGEDVLEIVLSRIADDERRANLQLLHLFHHPDTYTTCCDHAVCFKCKAADHHNGNCGDFIEDESVLDCPGCRVTLVKVDGCDSVTCLCGYTIEWPLEMAKQSLQRKQLAPADNKVYAFWRAWSHDMDACLNQIDELEATMRCQRLERMLRQHRQVLHRLMDRAVRRARLNILIREHGERLRPLVRAHLERRKASLSESAEKVISSSAVETVGLPIAPAA